MTRNASPNGLFSATEGQRENGKTRLMRSMRTICVQLNTHANLTCPTVEGRGDSLSRRRSSTWHSDRSTASKTQFGRLIYSAIRFDLFGGSRCLPVAISFPYPSRWSWVFPSSSPPSSLRQFFSSSPSQFNYAWAVYHERHRTRKK